MRLLLLLLNLSLTFYACVSTPNAPARMGMYYTPPVDDLEQVLASVELRNNTIEKHPAWIAAAIKGFMIKSLDEVAESDYRNYRQYLDGGTLYVIVHPAYFVFFHSQDFLRPVENPAEAFLNDWVYSKDLRFLQEQERALRDFLDITSTRKRLVILILPGQYRDYHGYVYKDFQDEYARYINSVTNSSESVLYLYSEKPFKGNLPKESKQQLVRFIEAVNPDRTLIGGGYFGRCVGEFLKDLTDSIDIDKEKVMVAGEISEFSPDDLQLLDLDGFLKDGRLDITVLKEVITLRKITGDSLKEIINNYKQYKNNNGQRG
jgi:hypothetical protein